MPYTTGVIRTITWYKDAGNTTSVSYAFPLVDDCKNHHQCKLQRVKTIFGSSRSMMQQPIAACISTCKLWPELAFVLPAFGCCILLLLVPKMALTLCNLHWWWFLQSSTSTIHNLHLWWSSPATCAGGVFLSSTSANASLVFVVVIYIHMNMGNTTRGCNLGALGVLGETLCSSPNTRVSYFVPLQANS